MLKPNLQMSQFRRFLPHYRTNQSRKTALSCVIAYRPKKAERVTLAAGVP